MRLLGSSCVQGFLWATIPVMICSLITCSFCTLRHTEPDFSVIHELSLYPWLMSFLRQADNIASKHLIILITVLEMPEPHLKNKNKHTSIWFLTHYLNRIYSLLNLGKIQNNIKANKNCLDPQLTFWYISFLTFFYANIHCNMLWYIIIWHILYYYLLYILQLLYIT
jgi:hypothetical protein